LVHSVRFASSRATVEVKDRMLWSLGKR
jgi:hypothetical protein